MTCWAPRTSRSAGARDGSKQSFKPGLGWTCCVFALPPLAAPSAEQNGVRRGPGGDAVRVLTAAATSYSSTRREGMPLHTGWQPPCCYVFRAHHSSRLVSCRRQSRSREQNGATPSQCGRPPPLCCCRHRKANHPLRPSRRTMEGGRGRTYSPWSKHGVLEGVEQWTHKAFLAMFGLEPFKVLWGWSALLQTGLPPPQGISQHKRRERLCLVTRKGERSPRLLLPLGQTRARGMFGCPHSSGCLGPPSPLHATAAA